MKRIIYFTTLLCPLFGSDLIGIVIDGNNNDPLIGANAYLSNQDIGTATNKQGEFIITDINLGPHELVVTMIGYKNWSKLVTINDGDNPRLIILMQREPLIWKTINVMGMFPSKHSPEITQIINQQEIKKNSSSTVSSILNNLHGIDLQMAHEHGRNVNISIRGSSDYKPGGYNNRVLLLIDGFPAAIPISGSSDWNAIPIENIERIEVVRGPASSLYGHNSMGGVINMVTKSDNPNNTLAYQAGFGSFHNGALNLNYSRNLHKFNVFTTFGYSASDGHRFNANHENIRSSIKLNGNIFGNQRWLISSIISKSFNGQPGFVYADNPELKSFRQSERTSSYLHIFYSRPLLYNGILSLSLAINHFNTIYNDRNDTPEGELQGSTIYKDKGHVWRNEYQKVFNDKSVLTIGTEVGLDFSKADVINFIYDQPKQSTMAIFSQLKKNISENWILDFGLRYDYRQVQGGEQYRKILFEAISPKLNFYFKPNDNLQYHLSVNRGFRAPSISELFLQYESNYGLQYRGNSQLQPEFMTAIELGIAKYETQQQTWFWNLFYNYYSNMIDFVYTIPVESINRTDVEGYGLELGSKLANPFNLGDITFSYSYLKMVDIQNSGPILYRPAHKVNIGLTKKLSYMNISLMFRYKSTQQYEDFLSTDHPIVNNTVRFPIKILPDLFLFDLKLSKIFTGFEAELSIKNIFNQDYVLIQNYPMPGTTWHINFSKTINE